jgi:hypothetical protein
MVSEHQEMIDYVSERGKAEVAINVWPTAGNDFTIKKGPVHNRPN